MPRATPDAVLDTMLDVLATATRITVLSGEPANFAGIAALLLAEEVATDIEFTKADGDVSGRKTTIAQQADVPIDATGTATHVALDDGVNLLYVTTCASQALTSGGTVTIGSWKVEIADPVAP